MATKIGFQLTNQPTTFDASAGLKDVLDTLGTQEKDREAQRQKWRDEQDEFFKSANDLKATPNQQANEFYGKWSGGLMSEATKLQRQLENGIISSRDYTAKFRNLTQSNEQMIGAQKSYQTNAQRVADGVADGSLSSINSTDFNEYNKALELGAIEVEKDGRGGFKLFNKNTGKVYNPFQLSNLTIGNIPRFDYNKAAATAVTQFGKRVTKDASGKTVKGIYANMPGKDLDKLIDREAKVFVGINQARTASILVDGLGYDVVYDKKDLKENTILKNQDGTFTFTDADKAAAVNEMKTALKNALPKDVEERQDKTNVQVTTADQAQQKINLAREKFEFDKTKTVPLTDAEKTKIALRKKEIGYLKSIDNIISGDAATAQSSIDALIQGANVIYGKSKRIPTIVDAVRSKDGKTLTVTRRNSEGQTISTPYNISDPNKAGEVMVELFFPDVKGSYEELLKDFNAEGGFTTSMINNPDYKVSEKGVPLDPSIKPLIPNPNYKGNTGVGKTTEQTTIKQDFNTADFLGEKAGDVKPLKEVLDEVDLGFRFGNGDFKRSQAMNKGAEKAFGILKIDLPNLDVTTTATDKGLEIEIPSLFEGTLTLTNKFTSGEQTKQNFIDAIKQIFNAIAKGLPFDKSKFESK